MTLVGGYVYVISLSNGTVKVGRSQDADTRLGTHKANARSLGLTVTDTWVSPLHAEWHPNEDALKKIAADLGGVPEGKETFSGIEFTAVVKKARELTYTEARPAPRPAPRAAARTAAQKVPQARPQEYRSPYWPSVWAPPNGNRRQGCLTPRERAVAHAALQIGMTGRLAEMYEKSLFKPPASAGLLDAGLTVDDLEAWSPDTWVPGLDGLIQEMKVLIRFECDIESVIAKNNEPMSAEMIRTWVPELIPHLLNDDGTSSLPPRLALRKLRPQPSLPARARKGHAATG